MTPRTWERFLVGGVTKWNSPILEYVFSSLSLPHCKKLALSIYTSQTGETRTLFNAETAGIVPKVVQPESEQEPNESRRSASLPSGYSPQPD